MGANTMGAMAAGIFAGPSGEPAAEELTPRESEVLAMIAQGGTLEAAARRLSISRHTVHSHVKSIYGKLGARSRAEAALAALRLGLLTA